MLNAAEQAGERVDQRVALEARCRAAHAHDAHRRIHAHKAGVFARGGQALVGEWEVLVKYVIGQQVFKPARPVGKGAVKCLRIPAVERAEIRIVRIIALQHGCAEALERRAALRKALEQAHRGGQRALRRPCGDLDGAQRGGDVAQAALLEDGQEAADRGDARAQRAHPVLKQRHAGVGQLGQATVGGDAQAGRVMGLAGTEGERRVLVDEQLGHGLAAGGADAFDQAVFLADAARIHPADGGQRALAALAVEHTQPVLAVHRAVAAPVGRNEGVALGGGRIGPAEGAFQTRVQMGRAVQADQPEVLLHVDGYAPADAAAVAARAALAMEAVVIIGRDLGGFGHGSTLPASCSR